MTHYMSYKKAKGKKKILLDDTLGIFYSSAFHFQRI